MLKSTLTVLTNMSYGCNDNLYRPQSTRTQHLKKVFTHPAKANLRPEYRARIQLKRVKFGLFSMFRYSPLPLTSDWIFLLGPNWTSWGSEDFSCPTGGPNWLSWKSAHSFPLMRGPNWPFLGSAHFLSLMQGLNWPSRGCAHFFLLFKSKHISNLEHKVRNW